MIVFSVSFEFNNSNESIATDLTTSSSHQQVQYAKTDRSTCKGCKKTIGKGTLRIAKLIPSPKFDGYMEHWFHSPCFFKVHTSHFFDFVLLSSLSLFFFLEGEDLNFLTTVGVR
jgi:hypothetical protein